MFLGSFPGQEKGSVAPTAAMSQLAAPTYNPVTGYRWLPVEPSNSLLPQVRKADVLVGYEGLMASIVNVINNPSVNTATEGSFKGKCGIVTLL